MSQFLILVTDEIRKHHIAVRILEVFLRFADFVRTAGAFRRAFCTGDDFVQQFFHIRDLVAPHIEQSAFRIIRNDVGRDPSVENDAVEPCVWFRSADAGH